MSRIEEIVLELEQVEADLINMISLALNPLTVDKAAIGIAFTETQEKRQILSSELNEILNGGRTITLMQGDEVLYSYKENGKIDRYPKIPKLRTSE